MTFRVLFRTSIALMLVVGAMRSAITPVEAALVRRTGVSKMDKTFARAATRGLIRDIRLAELAARRAQRPEVRRFAQIVVEHRHAAYVALRRLAEGTRLVLPKEMDAGQERDIRRLAQLQDADFDREFLREIAQADYVRFFKFELKSGALRVDPSVETYAREQLLIIQRDIERAQRLGTRYH